MNYIRRGRRAMFVGCSHGAHISPAAEAEVLNFSLDFRPHIRAHLGDAFDTAAFRAGATGTSDETASVGDDAAAGERFLRAYRPNVLFMGNHEDRLYKLAGHYNAIISDCAKSFIGRIEAMCRGMRCEIVPYAGTATTDGWRLFGDTVAGHGYMFGENCTRDHAEMLGRSVIHAHNHRCGMLPARTLGHPMGYSVGTLSEIPAMAYAKTRRATAAWSGGIVYGEYGDGWAHWTVRELHASKMVVEFKTPEVDRATDRKGR